MSHNRTVTAAGSELILVRAMLSWWHHLQQWPALGNWIFYLGPPNPSWPGNWGRAVLVNPPNNKESPSQHQNPRGQMSFLSDLRVNHKQHLGISDTLLQSQEECPRSPSPAKISPHQIKMVRGCGCWYYSPPFVFCLLTDICYHAKQVFLCKRTCPVCVSPSSLLRTQMSSVIKNPVNFWKETDGYPTRT